MLADLGLRVDPVSTQIVQRDRHAAFLAAIAILGGSLERLATEVRNLQHTEIAEVMEPFKAGQKGSSAMPHKRNPILSERIAGLARLLRGYAQTALENQPLWHERDISHSSAERVILPDATILLDYMLAKATGLVEGLVVRAGADAREHRARPRAPRLVAGPARAGRAGGPVPRGRLRDRPAHRPPRRRRARCRCGACSRPTRRSPAKLPLADLDACFDDEAVLRHVPEVIARLDALEAAIRGSRRRHATEAVDAAAESTFLRSGKVRDLYRIDDEPPAARRVATGSRAFDVVLPTPIPDKGRVLTGLSRFWFDADRGRRARTTCSRPTPWNLPARLLVGDPAIAERAARPDDDRPARGGAARRVRRPRLPRGLRLEGVPGDRRGVRRSRSRRACTSATACRSRCSRRPGRRPRASTTRTSRSRGWWS